jgi:hypothetical protein
MGTGGGEKYFPLDSAGGKELVPIVHGKNWVIAERK